MEQEYVIDSNIVIYYLGNQLPDGGTRFMQTLIDANPKVSVITKIEVLGFNASPADALVLNSFMNDATVLELDSEVVNQTIELRKSYRIKLPDAIIAATALVNKLILVTRNESDFSMIPDFQIVNPFSM